MIFYPHNFSPNPKQQQKIHLQNLINLIHRPNLKMKAAENYSLLRGQTNSKVKLAQTKQELQAMVKQREHTISQLSKTIEARRAQMKKMSKQINHFIEKQSKRPQRQLPTYKTNHLSEPLKKRKEEIDSIYKECEQFKSQIKTLKEEQPEQIVKETEQNQSKIRILDLQILKIQQNKNLLKGQLQKNKERLEDLTQNQCLKDLQTREQEYNQLKRQCKSYKKELTLIDAESRPLGRYYFQIKNRVQKQVIQEKAEPYIDYQQIQRSIHDINQILQQRNLVERQSALKIKQLMQNIGELDRNNKDIQISIRQVQNDILRADLESKRAFEYVSEPNRTFKNVVKPEQKHNPEEKKERKKKIVNRIYMMQKDDEKTIILGQWNSEGKVYSDRGQSWQISVERARKLTFLISNDKLVGIRTVYNDRNGTSLQGRTLLSPSVFSYSQIEVSLDEVLNIEYSSRSSPIYLRFSDQNTSKEIGMRADEQSTEKISLDQYMIKWIEAQLDHELIALRLTLEDRPLEQKVVSEEVLQNESATQRSFSNSILGPRRVLLKGRSLSKLKKEPIADHRLMLGKHKMV